MPVPPSPPALPSLETRRPPLIPAWDLLRRNRHVSVPMALPAGFVAAGETLAHLPQASVPTAAAAGVLACSVWWAAPHKWTGKDGKPRWPEVWYARASVCAAGGWLTACAFGGLSLPEWIAAACLAPAWGIPWWWHKRPRRQSATVVAQWAAWWQHYAPIWQVGGSHVTDVTTQGVIDTLHIQLWAGHQTDKDITEILPRLESALQGHVEARMTRCETVKGRPDRVLVHLKRENPHDREVEWDASLAPTSVTGLMPICKDEAGEWVYAPMLENWFIIGRKRSGKSNELSVFLASITGCADARPPWIIDLKGGRSARPWAACADWIATDIAEARLVLAAAVAELRARAEHCYVGVEQNVPTVEVPALFVVVDEAHGVLSQMSGDAECQRSAAIIASEGGAVNVYLIVMTQHGALHESVGTEQIRGNLPARMCFAVSDPSHGQFALTDWAKLDASRLENQGEFYWRLGPDQPSAPGRGPHMPHALVREIAARNATISRPPLVLYAQDHQQVYDARHDRLPASFRDGHPSPAPASPETSMPPPAAPPEPPWAEALQRIEDEVASVPDLRYPPKVDEAALLSQMERQKQAWADLLQQAPAGGISPESLVAGSGMGRTWTHEHLKALIRLGHVTKPKGARYLPAPGKDMREGLQQIKDGNDRLAEQARELTGV
jgi:hypothetical protein